MIDDEILRVLDTLIYNFHIFKGLLNNNELLYSKNELEINFCVIEAIALG